MATTHTSPPNPNLVPVIPSAALPQTPAGDWADDMRGVLGAHVTRTPVGTPGPESNVPGAFPDALAAEKNYDEAAQETTLLESARAYLPAQADVNRALSTAKGYLPQGVAAYLPGDSGPAPQSVDVGPGAAKPYTESAGPEPYADTAPTAGDSAQADVDRALSTAKDYLPQGVAAHLPAPAPAPQSVDIGPGASKPYTESAGPDPYADTAPARPISPPRTSSTAVSIGHVPYTASGPAPHSTTSVASANIATPTRDDSTTVHTGHSTSAIAPPAADRPRAASGLLPSHPAAAAVTESPRALTPRAGEAGLPLVSTPSLMSAGESGYAASSESESALVQTPASLSGDSLSSAEPPSYTSQGQSEGPRGPQNSVATPASVGVTGSAALNSSDPKDLFPADTPAAYIQNLRKNSNSGVVPSHGTEETAAATDGHGSDKPLNSSDPRTADSSNSDDADADAEGEEEEERSDGAQGTEGSGGAQGKKGKKPKLLQRLKEKLHHA